MDPMGYIDMEDQDLNLKTKIAIIPTQFAKFLVVNDSKQIFPVSIY